MSVVIERLNNYIPAELQQGFQLDGNIFFKFDLFVIKAFLTSKELWKILLRNAVVIICCLWL